MKTQRQQAIIKLISDYEIETQDELIEKLNEDGYNVTQATISRDIRELKISKVLGDGGKYHYSLPGASTAKPEKTAFRHAYASAIISIENAGNIIVVKTHPGLAQAVAAGIDAMQSRYILGSVAGDDTIIVVSQNPELALTSALSSPVLISSRETRFPESIFILSMIIDFPAPVSPLRTEKPFSKSISSDFITAIFSTCNDCSIFGLLS